MIAAKIVEEENKMNAKPILKWAGGKSQMLSEIDLLIPKYFNKYIEPFIGGGALFFHLNPNSSIISDSNPELINLYRSVAENVDGVIKVLHQYKNDKDFFYSIRKLDWQELTSYEAAARTIYLNRTCFNGLYRVNRKGEFNVPFGKYKNPKIVNEENLKQASEQLKNSNILLGDYKEILLNNAEEGDLIFLDPPYLPVSEYSDFKRYTKEQFYLNDHIELANLVHELVDKNCYIILTNSNSSKIHELYRGYDIRVINTKRNINSKGNKRNGEDLIITSRPSSISNIIVNPRNISSQVEKYPPTRYMGSKTKLLEYIWDTASRFKFDSVIDLFSGSGIVSYLFKSHGKSVVSNDYMALASTYSKSLIENNHRCLSIEKAKNLLRPGKFIDTFVQDTFEGLYFTEEENHIIDVLRTNINQLNNPYEKAIAKYALTRACVKKRPRGIFTYVGHRYDDGRKDLKVNLEDHFINAVETINNAVFDNGKQNKSRRGNALTLKQKADLVYLDPPYFSKHSDNEYVRRYHFVEGIACDWKGVEMQWHTKTKKFKNYPTPFSSKLGSYKAFDKLIKNFQDSIIIISYSSNCLPTLEEMIGIISKYKSHTEVISIDYKYSFGNQNEKINENNNTVNEYLFLGY